MNFPQQQGSLPQFSELAHHTNAVQISTNYSASSSHLVAPQNGIYTNASPEVDKQPILGNTSSKYSGPLFSWPHSGLMQFCDKPNIQTINIPNYSQSNPLLSNNFPVKLLPNVYLSTSSSGVDEITIKEEPLMKSDSAADESDNNDLDSSSLMQLQMQNSVLADYLQKMQAVSNASSQQIFKLLTEPVRKDKEDDSKIELSTNILNIPCVPGFRNNVSNGNSYLSPELMAEINPSDLNIHMESVPVDEISAPSQSQPPPPPQPQPLAAQRPQMSVLKVEQQVQTDSPKTERKVKFRAKTGEIKIAMSLDGSMLYCCPECNLAFPEKTEIEQHIQLHIQERKYECKECGAMLKRKEHLDQHMRGHSDERPFKCSVCLKGFKRNEHLTRHFVIHSGNKNFTCSICQKAFSRKDHLNKHTQTHMNLRRSKVKKEPIVVDIKEMEPLVNISKHELSELLRDSTFVKQDSTFLQQIQHLHKDQGFMHTFANFKEPVKDGIQQQAVNMNEILPQNTRYLRPS